MKWSLTCPHCAKEIYLSVVYDEIHKELDIDVEQIELAPKKRKK